MIFEISFTPDAKEQLEAAITWWLANRSAAPLLLEQESTRALARIAVHPHIGARVTNERLLGVRCVLLPRTRYQIFYRVRTKETVIDVVAFWYAERGSLP